MQVKLFLFGTGKISRKYTAFLSQMSVGIEGYIDNDEGKWGNCFYGKQVYGPEKLKQVAEPRILIACAAIEEISAQLSEMNLGKYIISMHQVISWSGKLVVNKVLSENTMIDATEEKTIIIDNLNGTWGGAEDWSHIITASLAKRGYKVYVVEHTKQPSVGGLEQNVLYINMSGKDDYYIYTELIRLFMCRRPFILFNVKNAELLWAASAIKQVYPNDVHVFSCILNDAVYGEFYEWDDCVDLYLCISSRIQGNLISTHKVDRQKVLLRTPFIEKVREIQKSYHMKRDEPLRIGYPCRLVDYQKRADLIPELLSLLEKKGVNYMLNIAGDGPCEEIIRQWVEKNCLHTKVRLYGRLSREMLFEFLDHQDVYLNFSEFEGTSLTMLEAMASGCVAVVTDVSGVSDFIENEINGLVADVGDLKKIAEHIAFLDKNRCKLEEYGKRSMDIVHRKCNLSDYMDDLEDIIESI